MIRRLLASLAILAGGAIGLSGCSGWWPFGGTGPLTTREFDITDFNEVQVSSAFEVDIKPASTYRVSVTAPSDLFTHMDIRRDGRTLIVAMRPTVSVGLGAGRTRASITMPELRALNLTGATRGEVSGFASSSPLRVGVSGASSLALASVEAGDTSFDVSGASKATGSLEAADVEIEVSGASNVELSGSAGDAEMKVSGASRVRLAGFQMSTAAVNVSGASRAEISVRDRLDVDLSGASTLDYHGSPVIGKLSSTGASTLNHK